MSVAERREVRGWFHVLRACLVDSGGQLRTSDHYREGVSETEKGQLSNRLGMGMASFVAASHGFPLVRHTEAEVGSVAFLAPSARPDLLGFDPVSGQWCVLEAKGRAQSSVASEGKAQANAITAIGNPLQPPRWTATSFTALHATPLRVGFNDPPPDGDLEYPVDGAEFVYGYYDFFRRALRAQGPEVFDAGSEGRDASADIPRLRLGPEVFFEIHAAIYEALRADLARTRLRDGARHERFFDDVREHLPDSQGAGGGTPHSSYGDDGIALIMDLDG